MCWNRRSTSLANMASPLTTAATRSSSAAVLAADRVARSSAIAAAVGVPSERAVRVLMCERFP